MWLYLPLIPSPSALGSADSTLGSVWHCRTLARSVTWRGKQQPPRAWLRRWRQGGFIRLLSGLTCAPSTLAHGADAWISSLLATRAKAIALPESGLARLTIDGYSIGLSTSSTPAGLAISSARTCRGTPMGNSPLPYQHWKDWAAALRAEYSARPKPETPCGAIDCSSWPSARVTRGAYTRDQGDPNSPRPTLEGVAQNWAAPRTSDTNGAGLHGDGGVDLRTQSAHWEGPSVAVTAGSRLTRSADRSDELLLTGQALETSMWAAPKASDPEEAGPNMRGSKGDIPLPAQAANWTGPAARDWKGINSPDHLKASTGSLHLDQLPNFVEYCLPPSFPAPATGVGSTCSTASRNTNQPSAKRKLNPIFVEALMRWPTGLSGFARQETAWTQWCQLMPSYVSALASTCEQSKQMELF